MSRHSPAPPQTHARRSHRASSPRRQESDLVSEEVLPRLPTELLASAPPFVPSLPSAHAPSVLLPRELASALASTHASTSVNQGTLNAMLAILISFGGLFVLYALRNLPWTLVRLSRQGWRIGWAFSTSSPASSRRRKGRSRSRTPSWESEKKGGFDTAGRIMLRPDSHSRPLLYPQGTPLVRVPNPPLFSTVFLNSVARRFPILRRLPLSLAQAAVISPFVLATVLACTIKSSFLGDAARTGYVPLAMLPFVIALGVKVGGLGTLLQKSYASVNWLHRWLGRLVFLVTTVHVVAYMIIFHRAGTFKHEMSLRVNQEAWIAYGGMCIMTVVSIGPVRRTHYHIFKAGHHGGLVLFLAGLNWHSKRVLPFLLLSVAYIAANYLYRFLTAGYHVAHLQPIPGSHSTIINISTVRSGWHPGQHMRIRIHSGGMGWIGLESHPFTVAGSPGGDEGVRAVVKVAGGWTRKVYEIAAGGDEGYWGEETGRLSGRNVVVSVSGPYGEASFIPSTFSSVMIIIGGSGVSFGLAHLEGLISDCLAGDGRTREVELVWIVREAELLAHLLPSFQGLLTIAAQRLSTLNLSIRLACTSPKPILRSDSAATLHDNANPCTDASDLTPIVTYGSRPDLPSLLHGLVQRTRTGGGVAVLGCGPEGLMDGVEKMVDEVADADARRVGGVERFIELFSL